ncbi:hypothetical protein AMK26_16180 [Streptomyces sp. CB03234]|uniref:DUF6269 family protein n=1 Tax=Streptomyces sp. (strain CB03234) TaxID=1703937 RepID=UPI0009399F52|nr:DUF6269 family protein [Streptomyces sp. CB03234]OKK04816.1 hypothetical protein AMK26_16180 [Streptomyces sp. CB03234]
MPQDQSVAFVPPVPAAAQPHPLGVLTEIEHRNSEAQEARLREHASPWAELLVQYVDALNGLIAKQPHEDGLPDLRGLEDGHAGGCG